MSCNLIFCTEVSDLQGPHQFLTADPGLLSPNLEIFIGVCARACVFAHTRVGVCVQMCIEVHVYVCAPVLMESREHPQLWVSLFVLFLFL